MPGANLIVFRDSSELVSGRDLGRRLLDAIAKVSGNDSTAVVDALLLAAEVECALSDCDCAPTSATTLTDRLAWLFVQTGSRPDNRLQRTAMDVARNLPDKLRIRHPEGFAYYALHPGDFADVVSNIKGHDVAAIVGIRSVGTTLSAVTAAQLNSRGVRASRITVRPVGHPYDRKTSLNELQRAWLRKQDQNRASFLVVDEGPGLSGSSFLSVAECLLQEGIAADRITMIGTRAIDPEQLCAADANSRWKQFGWRNVKSRISQRFGDSISLSGGTWRNLLLPSDIEQPACWPEMDGIKYWSQDRGRLFKFEGFGEMGQRIRSRAENIHQGGFGPKMQYAGDGMSCYEFVEGTPLSPCHLSTQVLNGIADYCAFRASDFKSDQPADEKIEEMVQFNFSQQSGREISFASVSLRIASPIVPDGRMQPYKWIASSDGKLIKVDGSRHGEDHFFPGPTDIAWDLAGAVTEWDMDDEAEKYLLTRFRGRSGINRDGVLPAFVLAYSTFRAAYSKMALMGTNVNSEKPALQRAHLFYRRKMEAAASRLNKSVS
jgi:hypothetical protein